MKKVELNIIALTDSESSKGNFALILEEQGGVRRLPIIIGPFEAQAIAVHLESMQTRRPLTHDLFKNMLDAAGIQLTEVAITKLEQGVFYASLIGLKADGSPLEVDARSSDAIAMAVRFSCPIFTTEDILGEAGIVWNSPNQAIARKGSLVEYSLEELEQMLEQVLAKEDYESAVRIREAIARKKE